MIYLVLKEAYEFVIDIIDEVVNFACALLFLAMWWYVSKETKMSIMRILNRN